MKEWKNKDVIIGLIVIIILGLIALFLLIRRELKHNPVQENITVNESIEEYEMEEVIEVVQEEEVSEEPVEETAEVPQEMEETVQLSDTEVIQKVTMGTGAAIEKERKQNKQLYEIFGKEQYTPAALTDRKKDDGQLKELYEYWESYKLNAVGDLIRLERFQKMSEELTGSNKFYYYGSVDRLGRPSGTGVAVYEDNTYYYGEWKEGLRHGKGMWLEVAVYTEENQKKNLGVVEHSYNGQWSKDLPNGDGQEHFTYDYEVLEESSLQDGKVIANVLGNFKDGYYHGEMYIMTTDEEGNTFDWKGNCSNGIWTVIMEGNTTNAVWESYETDENQEISYHFIYPEHNKEWGIAGLKK